MTNQEARQRKSKGSEKGKGRPSAQVSDVELEDDYTEKDSHSCTLTVLKIIFLVFFSFFLILILLPSPIKPEVFSYPEAPALEGVLAPNDILTKTQHLYENEVIGPESIVIKGDHIYTGTADGKILDIYNGEIRVLAKLGKGPCGSFEDEPTCGRPLGMRFDNDGYLVVCDAYLGLHKVNVATGDVHLLWPSTAPIDDVPAKLLNSLVVASDGTIYLTDSSTKWGSKNFLYSVLEVETTGRLIKYDPRTNTTAVLATGISFANGLELSRAEDYLIIAESTKASLWKYHLKGDKQGKLEIINNNLPGYPGNIQRSSSGGFWVGLAGARAKGKFSLLEFSAPYPWIKSILAQIPLQIITMILPKYGMVIEIDQSGKIIRSLHDPTGKIMPAVCDIADRDGVLYLGSYHLPYMGKVYLKHASKKS